MKFFRTAIDQGRMGLKKREHADPNRPMLASFVEADAIVAASAIPNMCPPLYSPGPLGNRLYGCCMLSALANRTNRSRMQVGRTDLITEEDVLREYRNFGWNPEDPSTDNGMYAADAIERAVRVGLFADQPMKIWLSVEVEPSKPDEVAYACSTLNGVLFCFGLPKGSQGQDVWHIPEGGFAPGEGPWSAGGHAIDSPKASPGRLHGWTWGYEQGWTPQWQSACSNEAYSFILEEEAQRFKDDNERGQNGLNLTGLLAAVQEVRRT